MTNPSIRPLISLAAALILTAASGTALWLRLRARKASRRGEASMLQLELRTDTGRELLTALRAALPAESQNDLTDANATIGEADDEPLRFVISAAFLSEVFRHVCGCQTARHGFREVFCYASGLRIDRHTIVVDRIVPVDFSHQSAGGVRVADASGIAALARLDELGLPLVAHFHSHPGFGPHANHPSGTDRRFQERLERGGHFAIGGIFARDGHLRFFAGEERRFIVDVLGTGFEEVEDHVFRVSWPTVAYHCRRLRLNDGDERSEVADRQDRLPGFDTATFQERRAVLIGAGGLGGYIAMGLARKGIGRLDICDPDVVELSNLNRQVFYERDLFKPKAHRLARNAARSGYLGGTIVGHHVAFDRHNAARLAEGADILICGVDNNAARADVSRYCVERGLPAVFTAVDETASYVWVFAQEPGGACLACVFPRVAQTDAERQLCRPVPAVLDVLYIAAGIVLRAVDSFLLRRSRYWNFYPLHLADGAEPVDTASPRPGCPICHGPLR